MGDYTRALQQLDGVRSHGTSTAANENLRGVALMLKGETKKAIDVFESVIASDPTLIEARTWRWRGHWAADEQRYRTEPEPDWVEDPIETQAETMDGAEFDGIDGLRNYLLTVRRDAFLRQFCRKLLGYALGRAVQLSDEPLLTEMQAELRGHDYHIAAAMETIVRSRPFREIRGREAAEED